MIVCDMFDGDDVAVAWNQHAVYGEALSIIVCGCRDHVLAACHILGEHMDNHWPDTAGTDHRTLQDSHDVLAGAWRYRFHNPQGWLAESRRGLPAMADWLAWLRAEVRNWYDSPFIVQSVKTILANQNSERGHQAEDDLFAMLLRKFEDVPWRHARR